MPFICRREEEGGLGYRETQANVVSYDLFIPMHLAEFVSNSSPMAWKALVRKYKNDEPKLVRALIEEIKQRMLESSNAATFLNKNRSITFEGENLQLFYVSGTEINGDKDFKKNIFAAVEEMKHNIVCDGMTLERLRPDISFFVNGIFLGYLELKSVTNGQTARDHGRGKVIGDYLQCVKNIAAREQQRPEAGKERKSALFMFEKAVHIVATDINETYILRNIAQYYDDAHRGFSDGTASISTLKPAIEKMFKIYPISSELLSQKQRFEEVMRALYAKKMIEKEILYYNFLQYKYVGRANHRERTSNRGYLVSPRPKQKFGCDKIMARVREMLDHEKEPDFYLNKLRNQLKALNVPAEKIEEIVVQRDRYCNNKYVYSLLMQYAAGFGKSNIIGWTALQLKDLRYDGVWAYDKTLIVVDRLNLRDQLDTMMMSMNIDKSMFVEATDQQTFVDALAGNKRIIVVNIQKFRELQNAINNSGRSLKQMRVAFLIDEIHRSNTGENNKEMVNLFEKLQDTINVSVKGNKELQKKKNLIIGFTATPTEKILARFGEFKSANIIPTWVPFDSYTMKEAIADGYILDPTKHIIPVVTKVHFDTPVDYNPDEDQNITIDKVAIYSNPERMEKISQFIVNRLVSLVYGKIRGTGKAMLAVSSIPNAICYCNLIRKKMAEKCEQAMYRRYKGAPISIVYSDNQLYESSASMNDGASEEKVISDFKQAKNGLMIVVDKLQTGFDEPKLHTLFLDKEIQEINAIQTISRVNRTIKYKEECHIVDLSWQNVNVENIREAFRKFCDITTSDFNPDQEALVVKMLFEQLCKSEPYARWYKDYKRLNTDTTFTIQMEDGIRQWIRLQFERTKEIEAQNATDSEYLQVVNEAKELRVCVGKYGSSIMMLEDVLDIDGKYKDKLFLHFWEVYCRIYLEFCKSINDPILHPVIDGGDEIPGITIVEGSDPESDDDDTDGPGKGEPKGKEKHKKDILEIIRQWNEAEDLSTEDVHIWLSEVGKMFEQFRQNARFLAVIKDSTFSPDDKMKEYIKVLKLYRIALSRRNDIVKVELFKQMLLENCEQLLDVFVESIPEVETGNSDYNYD